MTEHEYKFQQRRVANFYSRLPQHFFEEERTFSGAIATSTDPVPYALRETLQYTPISEGLNWGKLWDSAWIRLDGEIPTQWRGREIFFRLNVGGEVLVFDSKGVPFYSLTNTSSLARHYRKEYLPYTTNPDTGHFSVWMEAAANGLFGDECNPDFPDQHSDFGTARLLRYGVINRQVWELRLDLDVIMGLLHFPRTSDDFGLPDTPAFPPGSAREKQIMATLARAVDCYRNDPANAAASRAILREVLDSPAAASAMSVTAVGHAHIDTGWLWPVRESIRKCARTFASQLTLMDKYPDYVFGASQAQHYLFIKENYPELYAKIKQRVREGRWEIQGGMWVECDCNLTGGEALIRQFVHGKNFFRKEFGVEVKNLWLPDVFGYSSALPQIIRKCGCDHFLTQKLSWSDTNKFPYHSFHWVGIDGSRVLSFFPPEDTYNTTLTPDMLNYGANNFSQNDFIPEFLSLFGIGDGGGGPKEEFLDRGKRCANLEGCPKVRFGRADEFLKRLDTYADRLPVWHGELYLELHRGTLTVQAQVKRDNRRCEEALLATEALYAQLPLKRYPAATLDRLWKLLLLNQFHDILPGSSIGLVYERTHREHQEILTECAALARQIGGDCDDQVIFFNSLGTPYRGLAALPEAWENAAAAATQQSADGNRYAALELEPFGRMRLLRAAADTEEENTQIGTAPVLENAFIRYEFSADGELISIYDKRVGREVMAEPGNRFSLYNDIPNANDAWDIDACFRQELISSERRTVVLSPVSTGKLFSEFVCTFQLGNSSVRQLIRLEHNSARLDFITRVDWRESRRMLRVSFPTTLRECRANFDIQYGFLERPVHQNTGWDQAKFEVCMHRFADLGENNYGLALLNDCKYGIAVRENVLDLNLLRSPNYPDPQADRGIHHFTYALLPHSGDFREAGVQREAAALNRVPLRLAGTELPPQPIRLEVDNDQVVIESIKRAEEQNALVLRIVERHGRTARCRLHHSSDLKNAALYDMLEWNRLAELSDAPDGAIALEFTPFEIKTVLLFPVANSLTVQEQS